jgi:hypothetical protein
MNDSYDIAPFDAAIEDIHLYCRKMVVRVYEDVLLDVFPVPSPYTSIYPSINVNGLPEHKDLMGSIDVFFRNQGPDDRMALLLEIPLRVHANGDTAAADTFCKVVQFFFGWAGEWAKEKDLRDSSGQRFVLPAFAYSRAHFEQAFPQ